MDNLSYEETNQENDRLKMQIEKYKETIKLYEHHFEKANTEFRQTQEETRYMKQTIDDLRTQMKKIITEYNNVVTKHREIEEAFVSVAYLAKTNPDECIMKLERYYDEFQAVVSDTKKEEEKCEKERTFTLIKGGK